MTGTTLERLRHDLSESDRKIVMLLNERADLSIRMGTLKAEMNMEVYDAAQEAMIFESLKKMNGPALPDKYLIAIFREIISASRALQKPMTVAYLGPEATFSHLAARSYFGSVSVYSPQATIFHVFDEVERGRVNYGVVPVENSLEGSINLTLDRLIVTPLSIRAEVFLKINHCLLSSRERTDEIAQVYSIPQVLAQCQGWLRANLPHCVLVEAGSTAAAARRVKEEGNGAAIGSRLAAAHYGLHILAEGIEDNPSNTTRFLVVGEGENAVTGRDKTSILFGTPHTPGALYDALEPFAARRINLMKIESYPVKERLWEYLFFVDFAGHGEEKEIKECMDDLRRKTTFLKMLGSYPRGEEAR